MQQQYRVAWPPLTPGLKILLGTFAALYVVSLFRHSLGFDAFLGATFNLSVEGVLGHLYLWQPVTYQFLHDDFFHILFNSIVLWSFGGAVEKRWNTRAFLAFFLGCGLGGALAIIVWQVLFPGAQLSANGWSTVETLGASGGIMGVVAAYCIYHWNQPLRMLFIPFPIRAKHLLLLFIGLDVLFVLMGSQVSIAGHLGGMATGALLVTGWYKPRRLILEYRLRKARRRLRLLKGGHPLDRDGGSNGRYLH